MLDDKDIAELLFGAYTRAKDLDEFEEILEGYQYLKDEKLSPKMLFELCNAAAIDGYMQCIEELV